MLTMKRAFKNIWRRRFRTALVGIVLALCVAIFASTIASVDASKTTTAAMLDQYEEAAQNTIEQTEAAMNSIQISAGRFGAWPRYAIKASTGWWRTALVFSRQKSKP